MVRLKVRSRSVKQNFKEISIPYGSIKRMIPSLDAGHGNEFQFLMVRLKVLLPLCLPEVRIISISYGSIKSNTVNF